VNEGLCRLIVTDLHGKRENDTREVSEWACCFRQDLQGVKLGLWECHQKCESLATNGRGAKAIIGEHDASPLLLAGPAVRLVCRAWQEAGISPILLLSITACFFGFVFCSEPFARQADGWPAAIPADTVQAPPCLMDPHGCCRTMYCVPSTFPPLGSC
jgi:hypothetical protein